jgi:Peptidase family S41
MSEKLYALLLLASLGVFPGLINHARGDDRVRASVIQALASAVLQPSSLRNRAALLAEDAKEELNASGLPRPSEQQSKPHYAAGDARLDAAERQRVLDLVIANIRQYYFDRKVAQKTADALLAHERSGDYRTVTDGGAFADLLTRQMRDASHNMDLMMVYSQDKLPERPPAQTPEDLARYRKFVEQNNCFFKKVEILPHQIGYLKLDWFSEPSICQPMDVSTMASLNNANAIIFDLRDNRGGAPGSTQLFAAYLFDRPEYWYNPREAPTEDSWTRSPVRGNKLADKPVYLLTSSTTWSGAEQFCYNLKILKRATLVGERTAGGAHAGVFHRIDDHFGVAIPQVKSINPFGNADWEGVGVEPDVKVEAANALQTAVKIAEAKLQKR